MKLSLLTSTWLSLLLLTANGTPSRTRPRKHHKNIQASLPTTSTSTPTAPTPAPCHAKVFDLPWILTDITIFTPANQTAASQDNNSTHGTISFHFSDTNEQLQLGTDCTGTVIDGYCGAPDGGYVLCQNSNVAFKLDGEVIVVERGYIDDCLGPWPYNSGEAFGQNYTTLDVVTNMAGTMAMQEQLLVKITAMA